MAPVEAFAWQSSRFSSSHAPSVSFPWLAVPTLRRQPRDVRAERAAAVRRRRRRRTRLLAVVVRRRAGGDVPPGSGTLAAQRTAEPAATQDRRLPAAARFRRRSRLHQPVDGRRTARHRHRSLRQLRLRPVRLPISFSFSFSFSFLSFPPK